MMVGQGPSYGYLEGGLQSGNFPLTNPLQKLVEKDLTSGDELLHLER